MQNEVLQVYNWNKHAGSSVPVKPANTHVEIDDETWRDGMQGTQVEAHPNMAQRIQYFDIASRLGFIDHADIGFPASGKAHRDSMIGIIKHVQDKKLGITLSAAGRGNMVDDVRAILEVANATGYPLEADLFLDPTRYRAMRQGWDRNQMFADLIDNIKLAKSEGLPVMFVPERASSAFPEELIEVCKIAADLGVERIGIADTTGVLTPFGTSQILREAFQTIGGKYPDIKFDWHQHEDLKMGIANCIVAAQEGVDRLHAAARGIGERAGNVNLEQLLVVLNLQGLRVGDMTKIQEFAQMAAEILRVPILSHEPIVGERSTETASGIHANAILREQGQLGPSMYLPFHPEDVGLVQHVRIGPLSGLANVYAFCTESGIPDVTEEDAKEILQVAHERWGLLTAKDVKSILGRK